MSNYYVYHDKAVEVVEKFDKEGKVEVTVFEAIELLRELTKTCPERPMLSRK